MEFFDILSPQEQELEAQRLAEQQAIAAQSPEISVADVAAAEPKQPSLVEKAAAFKKFQEEQRVFNLREAAKGTGKIADVAKKKLSDMGLSISGDVVPPALLSPEELDKQANTPQQPAQPEQLAPRPNIAPSVGIQPGTEASNAVKLLGASFAKRQSALNEYQQSLQVGGQLVAEGAGKVAEADADLAIKQSKVLGLVARQQESTRQQIEMINANRAKAESDAEKEIKKTLSDIREFKIDPDRLLNKGANRPIAAIAAAIGELGAGLTGRQNTALSIIENRIQRDIAAQQKELETKKLDVDIQQNLLANMRSRYESEVAAENMAYASYLDMYKTQLQQLESKATSEKARAAYQVQIGELEQAQAQKILAAKNAESEILAQRGALAMQQAQARQPSSLLRGVVLTKDAPPMDEKTLEKYNKEALPVVRRFNAIDGAAKELLDLRKKFGRELFANEASSSMRQLARELQLLEGEQLGALSKEDLAIVEDIVSSDPSRVFSVGEIRKIENIAKKARRRANDDLDPMYMQLEPAPEVFEAR